MGLINAAKKSTGRLDRYGRLTVMARFPSKEAEVFALAQEMMTGVAANAAV